MAEKKKKDTENQDVVKNDKQVKELQDQLADALKKADEAEAKAEEAAATAA